MAFAVPREAPWTATPANAMPSAVPREAPSTPTMPYGRKGGRSAGDLGQCRRQRCRQVRRVEALDAYGVAAHPGGRLAQRLRQMSDRALGLAQGGDRVRLEGRP